MTQALIGHTGFVGQNLLRQASFGATFNSSNIADIRGGRFDRIVCAGVSAVKWWANQNPAEDLAKIHDLMSHLAHVEAGQFTLISTVDVYARPIGVDESTEPPREGLHAYGLNRLLLEDFVRARFARHSIARLPALFGHGLKKNAIYDLLHANRTEMISPDGSFQWYPLDRLSGDLAVAERAGLEVVNLATEPVLMEDIRLRFFPDRTVGEQAGPGAKYDFRSIHAGLYGGDRGYMIDAGAVFTALGDFVARERASA